MINSKRFSQICVSIFFFLDFTGGYWSEHHMPNVLQGHITDGEISSSSGPSLGAYKVFVHLKTVHPLVYCSDWDSVPFTASARGAGLGGVLRLPGGKLIEMF